MNRFREFGDGDLRLMAANCLQPGRSLPLWEELEREMNWRGILREPRVFTTVPVGNP